LECEDLLLKIVRVESGRDEVVALCSNFIVASAAYDASVSLWPGAQNPTAAS
jgi:hypothetical protein